MTSENSRMCATGCLNAKPDVLNCSCDLDFELWVFWLNLLWSWIVDIYAWSTIWHFFWPHIASTASDKSFKFKDVFAQFFPNSDYLFFWFKIYMLGILTGYHQTLFCFTLIMHVFPTLLKTAFLCFSPIFFISVAKTYNKTARANQCTVMRFQQF